MKRSIDKKSINKNETITFLCSSHSRDKKRSIIRFLVESDTAETGKDISFGLYWDKLEDEHEPCNTCKFRYECMADEIEWYLWGVNKLNISKLSITPTDVMGYFKQL